MSRVLVCTGCSSGLGFEALRQLLLVSSDSVSSCSRRPWRVFVGCRPQRVQLVQTRFKTLNTSNSTVKVIDLDLSSIDSVNSFANNVKRQLAENNDQAKIDVVLLSAAVYKQQFTVNEDWPGYAEEAAVNSFAQHYLLHLLRPVINTAAIDDDAGPRPRIVFVSSSKQQAIKSIEAVETALSTSTESTTSAMDRYSASKLVQMVTAQHWKTLLEDKVDVLAVSPGFVPTSGLNRGSPWYLRLIMTHVLARASFATSLEQGQSFPFVSLL
ncbi:hypothetical protein ACM66B_006788 [Microbotryomycetes sp. NB124-2]